MESVEIAMTRYRLVCIQTRAFNDLTTPRHYIVSSAVTSESVLNQTLEYAFLLMARLLFLGKHLLKR